MNKCIAIPTEDKILCAHFGHCQHFAIISIKDSKMSDVDFVVPPPHEPGLLPAWLKEIGVTDVIAGGIGQKAINLFNGHSINVYAGAQTKSPKELAEDLISGNLEAGSNYCDH